MMTLQIFIFTLPTMNVIVKSRRVFDIAVPSSFAMLLTILFSIVKLGGGSSSMRDRRFVGEIKELKKITPKTEPIGIRDEASDSDSSCSCSSDRGSLSLIEVPVDVV
jgi:hypothetical protein